jgi:hypothetical protein
MVYFKLDRANGNPIYVHGDDISAIEIDSQEDAE